MKHFIAILLWGGIVNSVYGQGVIRGVVEDSGTGESLPMVDVYIQGTGLFTLTDSSGYYEFTEVPVGFQRVMFSSFGYEDFGSEPVQVTKARAVVLNVEMEVAVRQVGAVKVRARSVRRAENPPIGVKKMDIELIERAPGGNRDISKVVQNLPGVAATSVDRNDIIVRGGGANENAFYIDRIEIPVLNHFQTQGSSGGNASIVNSDLLNGATLYTSAFPVSKGNALSSVLDMQFKEGNSEKLKMRLVVGASDVGATVDTPLGENSSLIASYRISYLQFLFQALKLPFLPTYQDLQFKYVHKFSKRSKLSIVGLAAYDINRLNTTMTDLEPNRQQILDYLPENDQWSYVLGAVYTQYLETGTLEAILSTNMLDNSFNKWLDNNKDSMQTLNYNSQESEIKARLGYNSQLGNGYTLNIGVSGEVGWYNSRDNQLIYFGDQTYWERYTTDLSLGGYAVFGSINKRYVDEKLRVMLSLRMEGNSYNSHMANPLNQLSPRVALGWRFNEQWSISANIGRYYQNPSYTTLGYRDSKGMMVNQNRLQFTGSNQITVGGEWRINGNQNNKLGAEVFYKHYDHYPMSLVDSTAIGSNNGELVVGAVPASSVGKARALGFEVSYQNNNLWGCNLYTSYTYVNSEYAKLNSDFQPTNVYIPTDWDYQHIFNFVLSRSFKKGWDVGLRWRYCGGAPYTPYDYDLSALIDNWDTYKTAVFDFSLNNTLRLPAFHQLDLRVDKNWYFSKWTLGVYLDIQNLYNYSAYGQSLLVPSTDLNGDYIEDPDRPDYYQMVE